MVRNLCPCLPIQDAVQWLGITNAAISFLQFGYIALIFVKGDPYVSKGTVTADAVVGVLMLILVTQASTDFYLLYDGARTRNERKCRTWILFTAFIIVIYCYFITQGNIGRVSTPILLGIIVYKIYGMFVVFAFVEQSQDLLDSQNNI